MLILFFKSLTPTKRKRVRTGGGDEALEKIRAILQERVDEAETDEDRGGAERDLANVRRKES